LAFSGCRPNWLADVLGGHDLFFIALDEVRALGRAWMATPTVGLW